MNNLSLNHNNLYFHKNSLKNPVFGSKREFANKLLEQKQLSNEQIAPNFLQIQAQYNIKPLNKTLYFGEAKACPLPASYTKERDELDQLLKNEKIFKSDYNRIINGKSEISHLLATNPDCSLSQEFEKFLWHLSFRKKSPISTTFEGDFFICHYTSFGYHMLNENLREKTGLSEELKIFKKGLSKALDKLPDYRGTVYRGIDHFDEAEKLKAGEIYNSKEFLSASQVMEFPSLYNFVIRSRKGKFIDEIARVPKEGEVLFKSNSKFKVLGIETKKDNKFKLDKNLTGEQLLWVNKIKEIVNADEFDGRVATYYMEEV